MTARQRRNWWSNLVLFPAQGFLKTVDDFSIEVLIISIMKIIDMLTYIGLPVLAKTE